MKIPRQGKQTLFEELKEAECDWSIKPWGGWVGQGDITLNHKSPVSLVKVCEHFFKDTWKLLKCFKVGGDIIRFAFEENLL